MNFLVACFWLISIATADHWPAFLGAGADEPDPQTLPLEWSPQANRAWMQEMPGFGQSTPVVWGERVFVTSVEGPMKDTYHTLCLDLASGEELWRRSIKNSAPVKNSVYVSRAAPTPVVDDLRVVAVFESGDCVAYDHEGNEQWRRTLTEELGAIEAEFGLAASPCQTDSRLFVLLEHDGPSALVALDKQTGQTAWTAPRESRRSWSSPAIVEVDGVQQIVISSAGSVDGYDPETGKRWWTFEDIGGNNATTPIDCGDGRFLVGASPGRNGENAASAADSNAMMQITREGDRWKLTRLWVAQGATPSWASPICHRGLAYWVNRAGVVFCFDGETGQRVYAERIGDSNWATPIAAGDRIYFFGKEGEVAVLAAGRDFEILAKNTSWDAETLPKPEVLPEETSEQRRRAAAMFGSPTLYGAAAVNGSILIRVGNAVLCFRKQASP